MANATKQKESKNHFAITPFVSITGGCTRYVIYLPLFFFICASHFALPFHNHSDLSCKSNALVIQMSFNEYIYVRSIHLDLHFDSFDRALSLPSARKTLPPWSHPHRGAQYAVRHQCGTSVGTLCQIFPLHLTTIEHTNQTNTQANWATGE